MERELKFRAFDKREELQRMIYLAGFLRYGEGWTGGNSKLKFYELIGVDGGFSKVCASDYEIMQFTGLKDKDGFDVYESDIVEYGELFHGKLKYITKGVVIWNNHCSSYQISYANMDNKFVSDFIHKFEIVRVLGNIYEHKHLLE